MSYKLLIIGNPYDAHIVRFVKYIKLGIPDIEIDLFGIEQEGKKVSTAIVDSVGNLYLAKRNDYRIHVKGFCTLVWIWSMRKYFHQTVAKNKYDIVHIHYPSFFHTFLLPDIKRISKKMVLTPWGSDVYRITKLQRRIVSKLYDTTDVVTGDGSRFTKDYMRIYNVPSDKLRKVYLFGEQFDYYVEHKDSITENEAKQRLALSNSYVITCGYNGNPEQRHIAIVEAINNVKPSLPENIALLFPFTYGGTTDYKNSVKKRVEELGFKAVYCECYLDLEGLFVLRKATDMFIHVQTTDANNSSLKEYLWFGKNVINGGWLKYNIETDDYKPYHVTPTMDDLGQTIIKAIQEGPVPVKKEILEVQERTGYRRQVPRWNEMYQSLLKD